MGYNYIGVIDGNDFKSLSKALKIAKSSKKPTVIHILTKNGKGYKFAEESTNGLYHGVAAFKVDEKIEDNKNKTLFSEIISDSVIKLKDKYDIKVIVPAMVSGSKMDRFMELYPRDLVDVGITEEHAITMATSASLNGKKVFLPIYSTFLQRAYDQILHDASRHNTNIVIGVDRAGLNPNDGETHQGIYDIAYLKTIPNVEIVAPSNEIEAISLLDYAFNRKNVVAIRYAKEYFSDYKNNQEIEKLNGWIKLKEGKDLVVISYGRILNKIKTIIDKYDVTFVNALFINPIDKVMLEELAKNNKKILVIEDVIDEGSLANSIIEYVYQNNFDIKIDKINIGNTYAPTGSIEDLDKLYKLDINSIESEIKKCA
jgi:1-deoxy-D-xylulose-5-phosphate synthase